MTRVISEEMVSEMLKIGFLDDSPSFRASVRRDLERMAAQLDSASADLEDVVWGYVENHICRTWAEGCSERECPECPVAVRKILSAPKRVANDPANTMAG